MMSAWKSKESSCLAVELSGFSKSRIRLKNTPQEFAAAIYHTTSPIQLPNKALQLLLGGSASV